MMAASSATSSGVPPRPAPRAPCGDVRPDEVDRDMTSSGKSRLERQYKGDAAHGTAGRKGETCLTTYAWFVGIDWGSEEHDSVWWSGRDIVGRRAVATYGRGRAEAVQWVRARTGGARRDRGRPETPRGVLVDTLLEQASRCLRSIPSSWIGFATVLRRPARKTTARRAVRRPTVCARTLEHFCVSSPMTPNPSVCASVSVVEELQVQEVRLANRFRDQFSRVDAPWLTLCPAANEPWLWTLLAGDARPRWPGARVPPPTHCAGHCARTAFAA